MLWVQGWETCLPLWGRWPSEARSERALSVSFADSSPKGRAKKEAREDMPLRGVGAPPPTKQRGGAM